MSVFTDCICGGPRKPDGDGEHWWLVCAKCPRVAPMPPAFTDDEWCERVRAHVAQRRSDATA